ncbi:DUF1120 domain-containing protein [Pseudomonas koreensis]|uniref:DUF1120 domain-containing protein n=1 Tax=Pseudomonas koreensis TaxID=198620 RepID=UPI0021CA1AAD|nr:DUF1120 domain-containing protein [Pseudomonas koreensis]MCU0070956.1 DUF1120 domain-containing protein [Pseudomonas koreensis]
MCKTFRAIAIAGALCPSLVMAAGGDLNITGTIVPTSCKPAFTGGNTVNLGDISAASLNPDRQTELTNHTISLNVTCSASAPMAIKVHDNQAHTQLPGIIVDGTDWPLYIYGIGLAPGAKKIGGYGLRFGTPTVDGQPSMVMYKQGSMPNWDSPDTATLVGKNVEGGNLRYSWGASLAAGPMPGVVHTFPMTLVPVIGPSQNLDLSNYIPLNGSATFELLYL